MNNIIIMVLVLLLASIKIVFAQNENSVKDSLYIQEIENSQESDKVLHAEPLYIDLIRDLGARKGEKEWNVGLGLTDNLKYDSYEVLVEYECAPINRLGLEIELPFSFHTPLSGSKKDSIPSNQLNSLKAATQWSFFVNERIATSIAIGYINEFEFSDFQSFGNPIIRGNIYNPFLVLAKRWGNNFHSLIYTGPLIEQRFRTKQFHTTYEVNTSFHYMISGTRNFIGVEFNKKIVDGELLAIMRPQMRVGITEHLLVGIVVGVPMSRDNERFSSFLRLIWEPKK